MKSWFARTLMVQRVLQQNNPRRDNRGAGFRQARHQPPRKNAPESALGAVQGRFCAYRNGLPGRIRTPDLLIRSQPLCPSELRAVAVQQPCFVRCETHTRILFWKDPAACVLTECSSNEGLSYSLTLLTSPPAKARGIPSCEVDFLFQRTCFDHSLPSEALASGQRQAEVSRVLRRQ